jgi:hypothetical protein
MIMPLSGLWSLASSQTLWSEIGAKCVVIVCIVENVAITSINTRRPGRRGCRYANMRICARRSTCLQI